MQTAAKVGSMIPTEGTAAGPAADVTLGLGLSVEISETRTAGDHIADFGEDFWNWNKGLLDR